MNHYRREKTRKPSSSSRFAQGGRKLFNDNFLKNGLTKHCEEFPGYTGPLFKNKKKTAIDLSTIRMGVLKSDVSTSFHGPPDGEYITTRHF